MKDLNSWHDVQGAILRVNCTYMVRLWRESKQVEVFLSQRVVIVFHLRAMTISYVYQFSTFAHMIYPRTMEV